jgi:hypothetical protein
VILSIAAHLILSAVDIAIDMPFTKSFEYEAVPRRNDRRSDTEAEDWIRDGGGATIGSD